MKELSPEETIRQKISEVYKERLGRDYSKKPPWQLRKVRDIVQALAHPDISRDQSILWLCGQESILKHQQLLVEYYQSYGLSLEITESLILFCATWDIDFLIASKQIDGVRFYNSDSKIAGPSSDPAATYENIQCDIKRHDPHMNIRIGRSATKEDVIWFINKYWESDIEPISNPYVKDAPKIRGKPKTLRDLTIYALRRDDWKYQEIQDFINEKYDELVEQPYLRKVYERTKPKYSLFDWAAEQLPNLFDGKLVKQFDLEFVKDGKNSHFKLVKM